MRILLDCRPLQLAGPSAEKSRLILSAASALSGEGIEWVLLADHRYRREAFPGLPGRVITRRALPGKAGWKWWLDRQIPRLAAETGVDLVWLTGGIPAKGVKVPVVVWLPDRPNPAENEGEGIIQSLYRRRLEKGFPGAAAVICYSEQDRAWLESHLPGLGERIRVVPVMADEGIGPLSPEEKQQVKAANTAGTEYFLADLTGCGEEEAVELLKAFSLFKKRQRSGMRLVLTGQLGKRAAADRINELLQTYKYRQEIDWAVGAGENARLPLVGAAYAVLLPAGRSSLGTTLLNTWKAGVPVIAVSGGVPESMAQGAILSAVRGDPASLAAQLMRIYKEEDLRKDLIGKGFERLKSYSRQNFRQVLRVITEIGAF